MRFVIEETATGWYWKYEYLTGEWVHSDEKPYRDEGAARRGIANFKRAVKAARFAKVEVSRLAGSR